MRKFTLEQRVARLEKLLFKKSVKNEDLRNPDLDEQLSQAVWQCVQDIGESCANHEECAEKLGAIADKDPGSMKFIFNMMQTYFSVDTRTILANKRPIIDWASDVAKEALDDMDEDEYDESHKRPSRKSVKNEDAKMMPNGLVANRVSDVLSGWAEVSRNDVNGALKALDRAGALDRACNRWYPTVDDVMAAIEDCWDDPIAMVGNGAAQFFISNNGDCALILQPIAGGTSRARQITLKFHWDV